MFTDIKSYDIINDNIRFLIYIQIVDKIFYLLKCIFYTIEGKIVVF